MKTYVIFISYYLTNGREVRLYLADTNNLSFTSNINYAKFIKNIKTLNRLLYRLGSSGYYVDVISFKGDIIDFIGKELYNNGMLSPYARCGSRKDREW